MSARWRVSADQDLLKCALSALLTFHANICSPSDIRDFRQHARAISRPHNRSAVFTSSVFVTSQAVRPLHACVDVRHCESRRS